jgi:hypothetical protein
MEKGDQVPLAFDRNQLAFHPNFLGPLLESNRRIEWDQKIFGAVK